MTLQAPKIRPILSQQERSKVNMFRETDPERRVWIIEKADYRGIISPDDPRHPKTLQRKGWLIREIPTEGEIDYGVRNHP